MRHEVRIPGTTSTKRLVGSQPSGRALGMHRSYINEELACVHIQIYIYIHRYIYIYIEAYTCKCMYVYMYICVWACFRPTVLV